MCVSQDSDPMNSLLRKVEGIGIERFGGTHLKFSDAPGTKLNSGRKGQSGGIVQKCESHERNPCALGFEE